MDNTEIVREAMRIIGSVRSPAKQAAAKANAAARIGKPLSEEHRAKLALAQAARRERERAAAGATQEMGEKRSPGRPRTTPAPEPAAQKRPRGRPKKQAADSQNTAQDGTGAAENTHG